MSSRVENYQALQSKKFGPEDMLQESAVFSLDEDLGMSDSAPEINEMPSMLSADPEDRWHTIFEARQIRIQTLRKRELSSHQEEQIEAAARLIELALK